VIILTAFFSQILAVRWLIQRALKFFARRRA